MIRTLLLTALPLLAAAETPGPHLSVPVLGYIFNATGSAIQQVSGVPGATSLDGAVDLGVALNAAWIDSDARVAVVTTKDGGTAAANWTSAPKLTALKTSLGKLTAVGIGSYGDRAALTDGVSIEVWSGLLSDPTKTASYHPDGGVVAVAVRQDGVAAAASSAGSILLYTGDTPQVIAAGGHWTAMAFAGNDLVAADAAELDRISADGGRTVINHLTTPATAVAVSADGTHAAVALTEDLLLVDLTGPLTPVACGCSATGLEPLAGNLVVYLAGTGGAPQVLDADAAPPRILTLTTIGGGAAQ